MPQRRLVPLCTVLAALAVAPDARAVAPVASEARLARGCYAVGSPGGRQALRAAGTAYRLSRAGTAFDLKPTLLGRFLLYDAGGRMLRVEGGAVRRGGSAATAGPADEWAISPAGGRRFTLSPTARFGALLARRGPRLVLIGLNGSAPTSATRFAFVPRRGCRRFPEAGVEARGASFRGTGRDGTVSGFVDTHLHITADQRAGGRVISGEPFDRFGVIPALGRDARDHGRDGSLDVTGNLLRAGSPTGTHSTAGWPTFAGWPVHDTYTHQQAYWAWLERAWRAGLRVIVAQTVEDDELCRVEPRRAHSCDEPRTITSEVRRLRALQDYVDAQYGGRGRGWFRLVSGPRAARRVVAAGKLAVVIGVESSNPFGCDLRPGDRSCTRADVDRGLAAYRRLGARSLFIAHWFDNAFAGAALEGGVKGIFINALNRLETGHWFEVGPCPGSGQGEVPLAPPRGVLQIVEPFFPAIAPLLDAAAPSYPASRSCNSRGLTPLGAYLVRRMIATHTLIEVDHLSERAREQVLAIAKAHRYPVISSHNGTGGAWTPDELRRLYALGGLASVTPDTAPQLVGKVLALRRYRTRRFAFGVGLGTDTGGFAALPGPRADAARHPLRYPFRSYRGRVVFGRERTGARTFDLNRDGVAHYGLIADLLADTQHQRRGRQALALMFRSAEAYLDMWRRTGARG